MDANEEFHPTQMPSFWTLLTIDEHCVFFCFTDKEREKPKERSILLSFINCLKAKEHLMPRIAYNWALHSDSHIHANMKLGWWWTFMALLVGFFNQLECSSKSCNHVIKLCLDHFLAGYWNQPERERESLLRRCNPALKLVTWVKQTKIHKSVHSSSCSSLRRIKLSLVVHGEALFGGW